MNIRFSNFKFATVALLGLTAAARVQRRHRLSRSRDFDAVYRHGRSVSTRFLVLYSFPREDEEEPRIGFAVPRTAGGAVVRNRIKRQLREVWTELLPRIDGGRDYDSSYVPEELLRNLYLIPFHAAVKQGAGSLMSAYMDLNDVPATGNRWLLHDVLRSAWSYNGFVVSDANSVDSLVVHGYARDSQDAAQKAFSAGLNMDMASGTYLKWRQCSFSNGCGFAGPERGYRFLPADCGVS